MKKNYLKIFIFIMIIFLTPKVFAQDFTVSTSDISSPQGGGRTGTYTGTEIYNTGMANVYNIGTRYNGQLSRIVFNLVSGGYADPDGFEKGHTYTLSMNMATDDWRNRFGSVSVKCEGSSGTELSNGRVTYVSYRKINFSFTAPSDRFCQFVYVDLKSSNITSTAFTGVSNWNLSSMVISDPYYNDGSGGSGSGSGSGSGDSSNTDIINNANQNTQDIINNNNQNTQDIINNNNSNTKEITDSINDNLNTCRDSYNLWSYGSQFVNDTDTDIWAIPDTVVSIPAGTYTFNANFSKTNGVGEAYILFNYKYGSLTDNFTRLTGTHTFTFTSEVVRIALYLPGRTSITNIMFNEGSSAKTYEPYGQQVCKNKLDETTNAINDVNNSINNDNIDSGLGSDFFNDFQDNNHGLTAIITAPLNAINSIASSSCQALSVPIPFTNSNVSLPCMTDIYEQNIPTIYNIWKVVSFGIIAYFICIDIFHIVKGFKDPESDKVEVLDL